MNESNSVQKISDYSMIALEPKISYKINDDFTLNLQYDYSYIDNPKTNTIVKNNILLFYLTWQKHNEL